MSTLLSFFAIVKSFFSKISWRVWAIIGVCVFLIISVMRIYENGYYAGKNACQTANIAEQKSKEAKNKIVVNNALNAAQTILINNAAKDNANERVAKYVYAKSETSENHAAICIPVDVADRLRSLQ